MRAIQMRVAVSRDNRTATQSDKPLDIVYDHLKDMVDKRRNDLRYRNRYIVFVLLVTIIILFNHHYSSEMQVVFSGLLERALGIQPQESLSEMIDLAVSLALLLLAVRYLEITIQIDRSYVESALLKLQLNHRFKGDFGNVLSFEGAEIREDCPKVLNHINLLYRFVIPGALWLVALSKICFWFTLILQVCSHIVQEYGWQHLPHLVKAWHVFFPRILDLAFAGLIYYFVAKYWDFKHAPELQAETTV